ncbi:integration host factor subunit beta [Puniceicoccales bacterium CK1056]|uniref:Integration host factor subunit beta n=1 Tax=Oceanipulchritudo coccoides TaxID=2706888 RepID=A0A6B2LZB6_9BACT|nr:HU family DNA-binding protein [Oceanipulchritudo coccoides]NDV61406.1 integration host factor subunit beta [Oceanipulchritudo coccoides]
MSANLTKRDIVLSIHNEVKREYPEVSQKAIREIVQKTLDEISKALSNGKNVELRNFGVFEVQVRKSRIGRNPNKPEKDVIIPERAVIKFKAGKELKANLKDLDLTQVD